MMLSLAVEKCFPICKLKNRQSLSYDQLQNCSSVLAWGKNISKQTTEEDSNLKPTNAENSSCNYFIFLAEGNSQPHLY
jgi:hypothetical protein